MDDLPEETNINRNDVLTWLGIRSSKTFGNMSSRFNGAKESLEWLRKYAQPLTQSDFSTFQILSKLVEGALTLLPAPHRYFNIETEGDDAVTSRTVGISAKTLDRWIKDIKERKGVVKTR
jgi:hypothetical protein